MSDFNSYLEGEVDYLNADLELFDPESRADERFAGLEASAVAAPERESNALYVGYDRPGGNIYNSYAGTDIVAQFVLPGEGPITVGEIQTLSYSMHRENMPVRFLGHTAPSGFVKGNRTIAGSIIFTVFNNYAFYRMKHMQNAIKSGLYPVADMLPPFDIVLTFANENGSMSKMKIYGVNIVDEGGTMSIDDIMVEQTYSFLARGIQPMTGFALGVEAPREEAPELPRGV